MAGPRFTFTSLGTQQPQTYLTAFNDAGQAVGYYVAEDGGLVGVVIPGGTTIAVSGASDVAPAAINASGVIVGSYYSPSVSGGGFIDSAGTITMFNVPGGGEASPVAINAAGQIAGNFEVSSSQEDGFIDTAGTFATIDVTGSTNVDVAALNASGQVAGSYRTASGETLGLLDSAGTITTFDPAGSTFVQVAGLNDAGEIVGTFTDGSDDEHGFIDDDGTITTLDISGATDTSLAGINDFGEIIGNDTAGSADQAFVDISGVVTPLVDPDNEIDSHGTYSPGPIFAVAINSAGEVLGSYRDAFDYPENFIATPCFSAGTSIATGEGWLPVQDLRAGDRVASALGGTVPVKWMGHREVDCRRHPQPQDVWPVRVRAGAFGPRCPLRDLFLSPDHAVFTDGVLIPIRYLLNGGTVAQIPVERATYWHVELPQHGVLLAEGLPCESYLDTGNRGAFANAELPVQAHPDFARGVWAKRGCAPLVLSGPRLTQTKERLIARLTCLG